jgi:ParB family chromosome partitioning protein
MNTTEFKNIPIDKIIQPDWDIRRDTKSDDDSDNNNFAGLVQSIKKDGIISPIMVSKTTTSDQYEIVAGRRRFKACKMLGLKEIPKLIRFVNESISISLSRNNKF